MRALLIPLAAALVLGRPAATRAQDRPPVEVGEPVELAFAGVRLALPKGFELRTPDTPALLVHAVQVQGGTPVMGLKLRALRLPPGTKLEQFVQDADPSKDRAFEAPTVLGKKSLKLDGHEALAQVMSYRLRDRDITAVWMFFLRPVSDGSLGMGYVMSVEARPDLGKQTLPVLIAVAESIRLSDPVRPRTQKVTALGPPVASRRFGYTIRPPAWWKVEQQILGTSAGVAMYQTDYVANMPMPVASLIVAPERRAAKDCAQQVLESMGQDARKAGDKLKVLAQGPARMGGLEGYEWAVRISPPVATATDPPQTLARRTVCAHGLSYTLLVMCDTDEAEPATGTLRLVAGGLQLARPEESLLQALAKAGSTTTSGPAPTTRAAPPTRPAPASGPASRPAQGNYIVPDYLK